MKNLYVANRGDVTVKISGSELAAWQGGRYKADGTYEVSRKLKV